MEHIEGYALGVATAVAMLSWMVTMFAVHVGLLVGTLLSLLSCFVRPLRRAVPYLLLMPLCAAAGGWGAFLGFLNISSHHLEMDQLIRASLVGPWAGFTLGALLGAALGYLLARFLVKGLSAAPLPDLPPVPTHPPH